MLRSITRQQVIQILEDSYFGSENFTLRFGEGASDLAFQVRFLPDARFTFTAERIHDNNFRTSEAPGVRFIVSEEVRFEGFDRVLVQFERWLKRVREEVFATNPFSREIVELREHLTARLASLDEELSGFFTTSEAVELKARLSAFEEKLTSLSAENTELRNAVESLSKVLSDLTDATTTLTRGTWYRMAAGRLLGGMKSLAKYQEAREFALEAAKKFLLEGPK